METWVGLIDCNNFFVSCERLFRPDLKGKPVLVLSSNDGCVVARSQEVKDIGIPMGIPVFKVKDIIKDNSVITFSSHLTLYRDVSRRVFDVLKRDIGVIEQYSIDEAFFEINGSPTEVAMRVQHIKDTVEREIGVPVSVGVAKSKTIAKYASSVAKKTTGTRVLTPAAWAACRATVQLKDVWGVGTQMAQEFRTKSLVTVEDFLAVPRQVVQQLFGVYGVRLLMELSGVPATSVNRRLETQKSILHTRSFKETTTDREVLKDAVSYHLREAAEDLRSMGLQTKTLTVYLGTSRYGDYLLHGGSQVVILPVYSDDTFVLLEYAMNAVDTLFETAVPYKKAGVMLTDFVPKIGAQMSFFESEKHSRTKELSPLLDVLNQKIGKGSVLLGSRLLSDRWQAATVKQSPAYTTQWNQIAVVKA